MKKTFLAIATAVALALGFTACEGGDDFGLTGHINLVASNASGEQHYAAGDSIKFKSALSNVKLDSIAITIQEAGVDTVVYDVNAGTVIVGSTDNIVTSSFESLTYPLVGINLRGTDAKNYSISCPIDDFSFFEYLDTSDVNKLISNGLMLGEELGNLFVLAVSEHAFYIGYFGSVNISKFGVDGSTVEGTVKNLNCIYVTEDDITTIANMSEAERASINLATYFPTIVLNGEIVSRRVPIDTVIAALEEN